MGSFARSEEGFGEVTTSHIEFPASQATSAFESIFNWPTAPRSARTRT